MQCDILSITVIGIVSGSGKIARELLPLCFNIALLV